MNVTEPQPKIEYNYAALSQGMFWLAVLVIATLLIIGNWNALGQAGKVVANWLREKRGDVLGVAMLAATTVWELIVEVWVPMGLVALLSLACGMAMK